MKRGEGGFRAVTYILDLPLKEIGSMGRDERRGCSEEISGLKGRGERILVGGVFEKSCAGERRGRAACFSSPPGVCRPVLSGGF